MKKRLESPSPQRLVRKEDVEKHPEYLSLKRKLDQLEGRRLSPEMVERKSGISGNYPPLKVEREVSPSFPAVVGSENRTAVSPIS